MIQIKLYKKISVVFLCLAAFGIALVFAINGYVKHIGNRYIISQESASHLDEVDCILVLGCLVKSDGRPSAMLGDRLKRGISLYEQGVSNRIIMSGDHGRKEYDEVNAMKKYAVDAGVPSSNIFMDHAGFSTYESIYRTKEIFDADKILVVSQEYHLHRALYIAQALGIEAYGVSADYQIYSGQAYRELREILARCKDFVKAISRPEPTFLGEVIPVSGDGDNTND